MAEDTDNLNLTDRQKTRLLNLALSPSALGEPPDGDEERGDLLHDILRCSVPLRAEPPEGSEATATASCRSFRSVVGPSIGALLQDPTTSMAALKEIKDYAKAQGSQATSEREKDVFLALYFWVIATAQVFHNECMTEHRPQDLLAFFHAFAQARWVPQDMTGLFRRAIEREHQGEPTTGQH
jgi:hypothetical protein